MVRTVFSPRWLLAIVVAGAFAVACVLLGQWQWGKYVDKQLRADTIGTHYGAPPVPLTGVLGSLPLAESGEWTRITARGTYDAADQLLVRNRVQGGSPGLEVLVPLTLTETSSSGGPPERILVDRGWVQNADTAAELPSVPPTPEGVVTVQGWLRRPEPSLGRDLPRGQLASIAVSDAESQVGGRLLPVYLVLESERTAAGTVPARPAALEPPDTDLGPNQAYAFQWWLFSAFGFVFYGYRLRVDRQERRVLAAERAEVGEVGDGGDGGGEPRVAPGAAPGAAPSPARQLVPAGGAPQTAKATRPAKPPKPKKVRIWDEEDS